MGIYIYKFGGTSLQTSALRTQIYDHLQQLVFNHHKIVMVVSAFGRMPLPYATDTLLSFATHLPPKYQDRMMALGEQFSTLAISNELTKRNLSNIPCTVEDLGIITDEQFTQANIIQLFPQMMEQYLASYDIIIVPGFQGMSYHHNLTTLGRGGSDLTAIIMAQMLDLQEAYCFTDVDGVYEYDPKSSTNVSKFTTISYDKMIQLIDKGAKIMCKGSILWAKQFQIQIFVGQLSQMENGTWIVAND